MEIQGQDELRDPTLEELGLHPHCLNCITKRCNVSVQPGVSCAHIYCPFKCGAYFHQCKADDHSELCQNVKTECLNSKLGCQAIMRRALCINHLQQCPAHVIMCGQSIARDDYESHFCDGHDHECEPVLGVWKEQRRALMLPAEEEGTAGLAEVGSKGKEKKEGDGGAGKKDETDSAGKKDEDAKSSSTPKPQDPLHTVPWQLRDQGMEGEGEQDGEDETAPPLSPPPLSPPPVLPSLDESVQLSLLPYGILQEIGLHLDRESLHELALTSLFFREVAASLLRKKGLVETRWKKEDDKWMEDGKIWRYVPAHLKPEPKES
ncbi:uncharacterized protein LOC115924009 [Strongylocentrotus purpuratus]|uniref:F-box domain-containing protein n=1 Tax=Strongylocentrotus purpuratus TaxID=7668 RepID=A0A7M7NV03_STRPU|nr:uncharacterized protein LOC115924009 [Strongylocentrotus purpuratus]